MWVCARCIADTDDSVLDLVSAAGHRATGQRADAQAIASIHVGVDADVIENCTAALSSLASSCDDNCNRISEAGGIEVLVALTGCKPLFNPILSVRLCCSYFWDGPSCVAPLAAVIASDNEVIHANAADVLVNITQHDSWETSQRIKRVRELICMCFFA